MVSDGDGHDGCFNIIGNFSGGCLRGVWDSRIDPSFCMDCQTAGRIRAGSDRLAHIEPDRAGSSASHMNLVVRGGYLWDRRRDMDVELRLWGMDRR